MPVVQPTVLPYQPTTRDKLLDAFISSAPSILTTLLSHGLAGDFSKIPLPQTPTTPGSLQFPSGARTTISPAEQVARGPMAGQSLEQLSHVGALPPGIRFQPTTVSPQQLSQMTNLAQLQQAQTEMAEAPIRRRKLEAETRYTESYQKYLDRLAPSTNPSLPPSPPTPPTPLPASVTSPLLKDLYTRGQQGDVQAMDQLRLLALEKGDEEAIAILQALGEL